jgi:uncharacterized protein (DUF1810 family)
MAGEKYAARLIDQAQAYISEPVLGAMVANVQARQGGATGVPTKAGFGASNVLALTDEALYAFLAGGAPTPKVREAIGSWRWGEFSAVSDRGTLMQTLSLRWNDGSIINLQSRFRGANKFQVEQVAEIIRRASEAHE